MIPRVVSYTIYHSPNAYLGIVLANRALAGIPVVHERCPILVPRARGVRVADLVGAREPPSRAAYHREDCARWAKRAGIPLHFVEPAEFERRAARWAQSSLEREELPARAYYAAEAMGGAAELDRALFEAAWIHREDVNDERVVRDTSRAAGLDPHALLERALEENTGRRVRAALEAFDAARCPGVPTFVFDDQRFWGKDRVEDLVEAIRAAL